MKFYQLFNLALLMGLASTFIPTLPMLSSLNSTATRALGLATTAPKVFGTANAVLPSGAQYSVAKTLLASKNSYGQNATQKRKYLFPAALLTGAGLTVANKYEKDKMLDASENSNEVTFTKTLHNFYLPTLAQFATHHPQLSEHFLPIIVPKIYSWNLDSLAQSIVTNQPQLCKAILPAMISRMCNESLISLAKTIIIHQPQLCESILPIIIIPRTYSCGLASLSEAIITHQPQLCEQILPIITPKMNNSDLMKLAQKVITDHPQLCESTLPTIFDWMKEDPLMQTIEPIFQHYQSHKATLEKIHPYLGPVEDAVVALLAHKIQDGEITKDQIPQKYQKKIDWYGLLEPMDQLNSKEWWKHQVNKYSSRALKDDCSQFRNEEIKSTLSQGIDEGPIKEWREPYAPAWLQQAGNTIAQRIGQSPVKIFLNSDACHYAASENLITFETYFLQGSLFRLFAIFVHEYTHATQDCSEYIPYPTPKEYSSIERQREIEADLQKATWCGSLDSLKQCFQEWSLGRFLFALTSSDDVHPSDAMRAEYVARQINLCINNKICIKNYIDGKIFLLDLVAKTRCWRSKEEKKAQQPKHKDVPLKEELVKASLALNPILKKLNFTSFDPEALELGIHHLVGSFNETEQWALYLLEVCNLLRNVYPELAPTITILAQPVEKSYRDHLIEASLIGLTF